MRLALRFPILGVLLLLLSAPIWAEKQPDGAMLSVGKDLTYKRGTAKAHEEYLEFPYYHRNSGNHAYMASVVHLDNGASRLIVKADECQGKKDKSGQLANQDFPKNDPFQRTLDLIKEDAFFNHYQELIKEKPMKEDGWSVLPDGSAVNKTFYKNSKGRWFCFLGVQEKGRDTISGPIVVSFQRTERGVVFSTLSAGTKSWSPPQIINPQTQASALRALDFIESRNGF